MSKKDKLTGAQPQLVDKIPDGYTPRYVDPVLGQVHGIDVTLPPADASNKSKSVTNPDTYFESMKQKVASGVDPNHLVERGYISKDYVSKLQPFYQQKLVYTQPPATTETPDAGIATDNWQGRNLVNHLYGLPLNGDIKAYTYTNPVSKGGMSKVHFFDKNDNELNGSTPTGRTQKQVYDSYIRNIGATTGLPNNPNSTTDVNKTPVVAPNTTINNGAGQGFKKGGPVKSALAAKIKGYDFGGPVTPDDTQTNDQGPDASNFTAQDVADATKSNLVKKKPFVPTQAQTTAALGLLTTGTQLGSNLIANKANMPGKNGAILQDPTKMAEADALKYAGTGAQIGSTIGSLIPGVGTLIGGAAGAGLGAIGGAIYGDINTRHNNKINQQNHFSVLDNNTGLYTNQYKVGGLVAKYAKGGIIKGAGGPKSDSISATIKEDSFVVPAEHVDTAKVLKKEVLGKNPDEKADLKQSGGEKVKLSNTEMLFTPEERYELMRKGIDVDALAPHAANSMSWKLMNGGSPNPYMRGCAEGGPIDIKSGHKGRFTAFASAHGMSVAEAANHIMANKDNYSSHVVQMANFAKNAEGFQHKAYGGKIYGDDLKEKLRKAKEAENAKALEQTANSPFRTRVIPTYNQLNEKKVPETGALPFYDKLLNSTTQSMATKKTATPAKKSALASKIKTPMFAEPAQIIPNAGLSAPFNNPVYKEPGVYTPEEKQIYLQNKFKTNPYTQTSNGMPSQPNNFDYGTVIGLGQSALGAGFLLNGKNKRPVDSLAPAFQSQLAKSIAAANYGYTPQQKALLNEQQIEARNNALGTVYNAAGGNGSVALNNARQVFNDSYKNKLATASDDEMLRLQKMGQANSMSAQDQEYRRRLFGDRMNQFQQNQAAYSNLLGAGLDNLIGSQRYGQQKQAQQQLDKINAL